MKLAPARATTTPAYPPRRRRLVARARGITAAALASAALCLGACGVSDGVEPIALGGDVAEPTFSCGDEAREWVEPLSPPGTLFGALCGDETAWGGFTVWEQGLVTVTIVSGAEWANVAILRPGGEVAAQIGPERDSVVLEASPGTWEISATPVEPEEHSGEHISVSIQLGEG